MVALSKEYQEQLDSWKGYDGERSAKLDPDWRIRAAFWGGIIPKLREESDLSSVLEVGGGSGHNLQAIEWYYKPKRLQRLVNLDVSPQNLLACSRAYPQITTKEGQADNLPFDEEFDLVISCGFLLHVPQFELEKIIREIFRVSKRYVVILEYYAPEEMKSKWDAYGVPFWSRDYQKIITPYLLPFNELYSVDIGIKNVFEDKTVESIQRGIVYERK